MLSGRAYKKFTRASLSLAKSIIWFNNSVGFPNIEFAVYKRPFITAANKIMKKIKDSINIGIEEKNPSLNASYLCLKSSMGSFCSL